MADVTDIVEGWTGALPFRLDADGDPVDLTGMTVQILVADCHRRSVLDTTAGLTDTGDTTGGIVAYAPSSSSGASRLVTGVSPYRVRFRVTDALGKVVFFPNGEEYLLRVNP